MRVIIDRGPALEALGRVSGATGKGNTVPILSHVLLSARDGRLSLTATDNDLEARIAVDATVQSAGSACVDADLLRELLRGLPEGAELALELESAPARLRVQAGRAKYRLPTLPPSDFPTPFRSVEGSEVSGPIPAKALLTLLDRTSFATSRDATRYYLGGVYLHAPDDQAGVLRAVATDGGVLALAETALPDDLAAMGAVTIGNRMVDELKRWLANISADVELSVQGNIVRISAGAGTLTGRTVDGRFPDYRRVIPSETPHTFKADASVLSAAVRRVMLASEIDPKSKIRAFRLEVSPGELRLHSRSETRGEAEEIVEAEYDGPTASISLNATYFLALLNQVAGAHVLVGWTDMASPLLVLDPNNDSGRTVVMPMRG